jgi:NADPH-dependent curcumin reductase CurA
MNPTTDDNRGMRRHGAITDIGRLMPGTVLGEVVESRHARYPVGAMVEGFLGWQNYALTTGAPHPAHNPEGVIVCDPSLAPAIEFVCALGIPGLTAWLAHKHEGRLETGETMVVTSAAGMVGCLAGQIGKHFGARVVGLTGTDEKVAYLTGDLGFDVAINYRTTPDLGAAIGAACPAGVDYFFDNTAGDQGEIVRRHLTSKGRVTQCGLVAHYNENAAWGQSRKFHGQFTIHDHVPEYAGGRRALAELLRLGVLHYNRTEFDGLEATPGAFISLLQGGNIGKFVVRVH